MACFDYFFIGAWLLALAGCGGRTALEDGPGSGPAGGAGAGANGAGANGAGAGPSNYDPDEECPVVGCSGEDTCPPAVLTGGRPIGWATIDGGDLYFTTNDPEGENALIRIPVCGGKEQVLLERERFAGEGAIVGDYLYVPVEEPAREVLRMPKLGGGASVIHSYDADDPYVTRAITAANGYVMLSQYSFDGGLVLNEINPQGKAHELNDNLPDQDWFLVTTVASGFLPNKPLFIEPQAGDPYGALIGADFGIYRVRAFDALQGGDQVFIEPFHLELPVAGPLLTKGAPGADPTVYFSSDESFVWPVHYKLSGDILEPILVEDGGILLAIDGDQLFGSSNDFYMEGFEDNEFGGEIWQAAETDEYAENVFSTRFQNPLALEIHGASVYVRTSRAVVRFPKDCMIADHRCHFYYEE